MKYQEDKITIVATKRTPIGQYLGALTSFTAPMLASAAIKASLLQSNISPLDIDEVLMGCVLSAGIGQAPARQAALGADLPEQVACTTINKMCGSGMKAIMLGADQIAANNAKIVLAGGMESMTNAPYLLNKARSGYKMGHGTIYDHMFLDGLEDAYDKGKLMGVFAELCAEKYNISREEQDAFALQSLLKSKNAIKQGFFHAEIAPVTVSTKKETVIISEDELPSKAMPDKIPTLKAAFKENGTVTAANASGISDGAAAHILMSMREAINRNIAPLAIIQGYTTHAQTPSWFTTAPLHAIEKLLKKVNWTINEVDLFEINEAFAVVALCATRHFSLPLEKVNVHGGACALGHPIGASGARIVTTLIYALKHYGLKRGVAALCIGGGEATALAIEVP